MKKLVLHLEALEVESFETLGGSALHGTINGRVDDGAVPAVPATNEQFCTLVCKTVGGLPCDTELCRTKEYTCAKSCGYIVCVKFGENEEAAGELR